MAENRLFSRDEVQSMRDHLRRFNGGGNADLAERSDEEIAAAIAEAKEWIGTRRWSWHIVATNVLIDGKPSARIPR